ncbi:MAG: FAD-binding protein, partial [Solirubrobacterales bacterium]
MSERKWWGWGAPGRRSALGPSAVGMLRERLGEAEPSPPVSLDEVSLPAPAAVPESVVRAVGADSVLAGDEARLRHAAGMSYPDLVRLRSGRIETAPDAVVIPRDREQVAAVLAACAGDGVAVVPFGGGTSVVGGVDPIRGRFERLVALDLARLRPVSVDRRSLT